MGGARGHDDLGALGGADELVHGAGEGGGGGGRGVGGRPHRRGGTPLTNQDITPRLWGAIHRIKFRFRALGDARPFGSDLNLMLFLGSLGKFDPHGRGGRAVKGLPTYLGQLLARDGCGKGTLGPYQSPLIIILEKCRISPVPPPRKSLTGDWKGMVHLRSHFRQKRC